MSDNFGFIYEPTGLQPCSDKVCGKGKKNSNKQILTIDNFNNQLGFRMLVKQNAVIYLADDPRVGPLVNAHHKEQQFSFVGMGLLPPSYEYPFQYKAVYTTLNEDPVAYLAIFFTKVGDAKFVSESSDQTLTVLIPIYEDRAIYKSAVVRYRPNTRVTQMINKTNIVERFVDNAINAYKLNSGGSQESFGRWHINPFELLNTDVRGKMKLENFVGNSAAGRIYNGKQYSAFFRKTTRWHHAKHLNTVIVPYYWKKPALAVVPDMLLPASQSPYVDNVKTLLIFVDDTMFISSKTVSKLSLYSGLAQPARAISETIARRVEITKKSEAGVAQQKFRDLKMKSPDERFKTMHKFDLNTDQKEQAQMYADAIARRSNEMDTASVGSLLGRI